MKLKALLRLLLSLLVVGIVGGVYLWIERDPSILPQCNVLLITLDTTRADHLGCYGYEKPTSPHLDELASTSSQFDFAIAQASVTPVSHASILTGLQPFNHGLRVLHGLVENSLSGDRVTLSEVWKAVGGQTAAFVSAFPAGVEFGLDQGFDHFDAEFPQSDGKGVVNNDGSVNTGLSQRRADDTTNRAIEWLQKKADPEVPFLMWVHYFDPHDHALLPTREFLGGLNTQLTPKSEGRKDVLLAHYDAEIFYMDLYIGKLLEAVKQHSDWDQTMVVVVADHGEGLGDHDWWSHGILYQEQIRVPLIIRAPDFPGRIRVPSVVSTIDLMPTILEIANVQPDLWPSMDGSSLTHAMRTGRMSNTRMAYADSVNILGYVRPDRITDMDQKADKLYCLTDGAHKLIYHQLQPENTEFYSLQNDPGELNNLASAKPVAMRKMMNRLKILNPFSEIMPGMTSSNLKRIRNLKSLGYTQ